MSESPFERLKKQVEEDEKETYPTGYLDMDLRHEYRRTPIEELKEKLISLVQGCRDRNYILEQVVELEGTKISKETDNRVWKHTHTILDLAKEHGVVNLERDNGVGIAKYEGGSYEIPGEDYKRIISKLELQSGTDFLAAGLENIAEDGDSFEGVSDGLFSEINGKGGSRKGIIKPVLPSEQGQYNIEVFLPTEPIELVGMGPLDGVQNFKKMKIEYVEANSK